MRRWHVHFYVTDFPSFQSNNFWNTISWKCFLKDDCIRSSLTECQSFLNRKIDLDPGVLMSFSMLYSRYCAWRGTFKSISSGSTWLLLLGSDQQARRILSVSCSNFDLQVPIPNWWWNANSLHIPLLPELFEGVPPSPSVLAFDLCAGGDRQFAGDHLQMQNRWTWRDSSPKILSLPPTRLSTWRYPWGERWITPCTL